MTLASTGGATVTPLPSTNGQTVVSIAVASTNLRITFDPKTGIFTFLTTPTLRPGARISQIKTTSASASVLHAVSVAPALAPSGATMRAFASSLSGHRSAVAAVLPGAIQVTGPNVLIPTTVINFTATAPDGSSYTIPLPIALTLPGETTTLTATSVDRSGNFGTNASTAPVLSRDGQVVSFQTLAPNLTNVGQSFGQVGRYAVALGYVDHVSQGTFMGTAGGRSTNAVNLNQALSADGRWLAFASDAPDFVPIYPGPTSRQIYLTRADQAIVSTTTPSPTSAVTTTVGGFYAGAMDRPSLSSDGTTIAFESDETSLVSGITPSARQVYVENFTTGTIALVSSSSAGVIGNAASTNAQVSDDGTLVLFESDATNFGVSGHQIWLKNLATGSLTLVSAANDNRPGNATSTNCKLSGDGRTAAFESDATNLVTGIAVTNRQVYLRNITSSTTSLASIGADGKPAATGAQGASIAADGRFVVFQTAATNMITGQTPTNPQVYVRDQFARITNLVSNDVNGLPGNGDSVTPAISGNGRVIAFASTATNLDGTQTNKVSQVYIAGNPLTSPLANGWWWNPATPGQGVAIEERGDSLFVGTYQYAPDTTPLWLAASAGATGTNGFSGSLFQYANGSTLSGTYQPASVAANLGTASLALSNLANGSLTIGTSQQPLQRFEFVTGGVAAGPVAGYPETGWWYNPATPGQGLFMEVQGTSLFATLFAYDTRGQATWYLAQGAMGSARSFTGALNLCQGLPNSAPSGVAPNCTTSAGAIVLAFTSLIAGSATVTSSQASKPVIYAIKRYTF
jgi:Tol biopolymer transport system component